MRIMLVCGVLFCAIASFAQESTYKIELEVEGLEDSVAYLGYHLAEKKYLQDTSEVSKGGKVIFEGNKDLKSGLYFLYSKNTYFEFIVDEQNFKLTTKRSNTYKDMKVYNSKSNEYFRDFQNLMIAHQRSVTELNRSLDSTSTASDSAVVISEVRTLSKANELKRDSLTGVYKDSFVGQLLGLMNLSPGFDFKGDSLSREEKVNQYSQFRRTYFDAIDFSSDGLLRTPIFKVKVLEYLDKVTFQYPDSVIRSIDLLLEKSEPNEELYRYLLGTFFEKYQNPEIMGMDKIFVYLSDEYYLNNKAPWADESMLQELRDEMRFHRDSQIGLRAPQIYYQDTSNVNANLYSIKKDYIILYFYSPTCGHCKKKTPVLKEVYDKLDGKAEVVAVCTDTDMDKWKAFIKKLELDWLNYADMEYKSNFRMQYNVRSTPMIYVLDKDKMIIAKKLDVEQLEGFINDKIKQEEKRKEL